VHHSREVEGKIAHGHAENRAADNRAGAVAVIEFSSHQRLDTEIGTQRNVNEVDAFVAVKTALDAVKQGADR